jgi:hypothetical protein
MLLLTVLFPTLLFVETADDGVTSDFLHKYLHFLLQGLLPGCTLYCGQSLLQLIVILLLWTTSNYAKFQISGHSIPTKKTHNETGQTPRCNYTILICRMIHCCIECTEKTGPYNTTCVTVIMESKH